MEIKVKFQDILNKYGQQISGVEKNIRKGKSKHNQDALDTFDWYISWCEQVKAISAKDLFKPQPVLTEKETIKQRIANSYAELKAKKGRCVQSSDTPIIPCDEVSNEIRRQVREIFEEKARVDGLTTQQRDQETQDLLKELSKGRGFFGVAIKK